MVDCESVRLPDEMPVTKVVIIGAGIAGTALALLLKSQLNISCTLYELRSSPTTLGGAIIVSWNALRILDALGIYEELQANCAETPDFEAYNANGGKIGTLRLGAFKRKYRYGVMRVLRSVLHRSLLRRLYEEGIDVKYGMKVTEIEETKDSIKIIFADGMVENCDLLVGADGIHSAVRSLHVDPELEPEYTGISVLYGLVPTCTLSSPIYFSGNFASIMFRQGIFATGFCDPQRETMYWFIGHEVPARNPEGWTAQDKESEKVKAEVRERIKDVKVPLINDILNKSPGFRFYPIFRLPLQGKWYTERTILIGDSAHAIPPHAGQGIGMALEDAYLLSRLLKKGYDLGHILQEYDTIRRPRINMFAKMAHRGGDMRRETGAWAQWGKETLMWLWLKIMPLAFWLLLNVWPERWMPNSFNYDIMTVTID